MKILAIDPGYDRLGIGILDISEGVGKEKVVYSSCIETSPKDNFEDRLEEIYNSTKKVIQEYKPSSLAIESLFLSMNKKTAMKVAEAKGVVILAAKQSGLSIYEYTPLQIKVAVTGHGRSEKKQIEDMVRRLVSVDDKKMTDDELDAIAVGITHSAMKNSAK